MNRVVQYLHRSREFFTEDSWQFSRRTLCRGLLILPPFRQGSNSRGQLGNGRGQAVGSRPMGKFPEVPAGGLSAFPLRVVHRRELFQHLLHGLSGKECVDEAEERMVRVHQPENHRFFDEGEEIGGDKSDDGREELSGQSVDEPLNADNLLSIRVKFAETDK